MACLEQLSPRRHRRVRPGSFDLINVYGVYSSMQSGAAGVRGAGPGVGDGSWAGGTRLYAPANSNAWIQQGYWSWDSGRERTIEGLTLDGAYVGFTWQPGVALQNVEIKNALWGVRTRMSGPYLIQGCNIHDIQYSGVGRTGVRPAG